MPGSRLRPAASLLAVLVLLPLGAAERPAAPRRWVLGETLTLEGVGRAQGATVHEGKLYVYGDAETGVVVEFTLEFQPTGHRVALTRGGHDLLSHPTALTFHPEYGVFLGDSPWGLFGRGADIYRIDWERGLAEGNLDNAVRAKIKDDLAKSGTRPEFVRVGDRWLLASADYREDSAVRLYNPAKLRDGGKTSEEGVLVGSFQLKGRTQSLLWEDETGWLYCVQNPRGGRGWRVIVVDLEKAIETGGYRAALVEQQDFPLDSELEGLAFLPGNRALFLTSDKRDNARLARLEAAPED